MVSVYKLTKVGSSMSKTFLFTKKDLIKAVEKAYTEYVNPKNVSENRGFEFKAGETDIIVSEKDTYEEFKNSVLDLA